MKLSDINVSTLFINKYTRNLDYKNNYEKSPIPYHSLAIMLKGTCSLHCKGEVTSVYPGDVFFIPQNCLYRSSWHIDAADREVSFYSMHFSFDTAVSDFNLYNYKIQKFSIADATVLINKFEELQNCLLYSLKNNFYTASLFFDILSVAISEMNTSRTGDFSVKIKPSVEYLQKNFHSSVSVKFLASICFLSESRFFTLFKKQTGMSPIQYKNYLKLNQIAQYLLLYPDKSIEDIADEFGFSSSVYLIRQFKKQFGKNPFYYRKEALLYKI